MTEFKRQKKKKKTWFKILLSTSREWNLYLEWIWPFCAFKKKKIGFKIKQKNFILINREHWSPFGYIYKIALKMILWEVAHWISPQRNKCRKVSMGHCWIEYRWIKQQLWRIYNFSYCPCGECRWQALCAIQAKLFCPCLLKKVQSSSTFNTKFLVLNLQFLM